MALVPASHRRRKERRWEKTRGGKEDTARSRDFKQNRRLAHGQLGTSRLAATGASHQRATKREKLGARRTDNFPGLIFAPACISRKASRMSTFRRSSIRDISSIRSWVRGRTSVGIRAFSINCFILLQVRWAIGRRVSVRLAIRCNSL
jgi:hypothetical protein